MADVMIYNTNVTICERNKSPDARLGVKCTEEKLGQLVGSFIPKDLLTSDNCQ